LALASLWPATPFVDVGTARREPDLLREIAKTIAETWMGAEVEAVSTRGYRERPPARSNSGNGPRPREWDTRVGTIELAVSKLWSGV
jgi:putative transposase